MKKRFLAAVVAGALSLSMVFAMAADATTFTDAAQIEHWDAVATLTQLNVVSGKDDGSFDPAAPVTRAEMAKLVCLMLNGGAEPQWGSSMDVKYTDAQGHWAKNYIMFCDASGIIAGRGDGNFDPDATVTGAEAVKMAIVMLGYDANIFLLTGAKWEENTLVLAQRLKLFAGLKEALNTSEPMSRDGVALILYNALSTKTMDTSWDTLNANGEITYKYSVGDKTFYETRFAPSSATSGSWEDNGEGGYQYAEPTPAPSAAPLPLPSVPAQPK